VLKIIVIDGANPEMLPPMSTDEQKIMGDEIFARNLGFADGGVTRVLNSSAASSDSEPSTPSLGPLDSLMLKIRSHIALGLLLMSNVKEGSWLELGTRLPTKMTLVKCVEENYLKDGQFGSKGEGLRALMTEDYMGWKAQCFQELEVVKLNGCTHDTCFEEGVVEDLTDILVESLVDVD
jgi:hypothetical protein